MLASASDAAITVVVQGAKVKQGVAHAVPLNGGETTMIINVTSIDQATTNTYEVTCVDMPTDCADPLFLLVSSSTRWWCFGIGFRVCRRRRPALKLACGRCAARCAWRWHIDRYTWPAAPTSTCTAPPVFQSSRGGASCALCTRIRPRAT